MTRVSRLHVPHPPARPGEVPDFSHLRLSDAGAAPRPEVSAHVRDMECLAYDLVRVLDDEHRAVGPWRPDLEVHALEAGLRHMVLTRAFDARMLRMQRQGKLSFYRQSLGEEAVSVAQAMALEPGDMLFPHYCNVGLHIARGRDPVELMCQCLSNTKDSPTRRTVQHEGHVQGPTDAASLPCGWTATTSWRCTR